MLNVRQFGIDINNFFSLLPEEITVFLSITDIKYLKLQQENNSR